MGEEQGSFRPFHRADCIVLRAPERFGRFKTTSIKEQAMRRSIYLMRLSAVAFACAASMVATTACGGDSRSALDPAVATRLAPSPLAVNSGSVPAIKILSGQLVFDRAAYRRSIELKGTHGLRLSGDFATAVVLDSVNKCEPCVPGDIIPVNAYISNGDFPGTATLQGKTYSMGGLGVFDASATLDITGGQVTMPPITAGSVVTLSTSFELVSGGLTHSHLTVSGESPRWLTGGGIATLQFQSVQAGPGEYVWLIMKAVYDFGH